MHYSGNIHFIAEDDRHAAALCRRLLSFLPSNNMEDPPRLAFPGDIGTDDAIGEILPC